MNFLAHLYLSGDNDEVKIGNFIADAVKGNHLDRFPDGIRDGIRFHRAIDYFTDHHPVFRQSKHRLRPKYKLVSGIIVDIYYDHFLARNWADYSDEKLSKYTSAVYALMIRNYKLLPSHTKRLLPFLITQDWLAGYAEMKSLKRVFKGMSRRFSFDSGMENAVDDLLADYGLYKTEFIEFFYHLQEFSKEYIITHNIGVLDDSD